MLTNIIKITTNSSWIIITIKHSLRTLSALFFTDSILPNNLNLCNMQNLYFYTLSLQILIHLLGVKKDILTSFYRFEIIISKRTSYFSLGSHNLVSECLIQWMVTISSHLWCKFILHSRFCGHLTPNLNLVYCIYKFIFYISDTLRL